jgi:3D (Asp-Asp-Asp) domain-containing protein
MRIDKPGSMRLVIALALLPCIAAAPAEAPGGRMKSRHARVMTVSATAYCQHGLTASGIRTQHGIVAADTRVLRFGTRLRIAGRHGVYHVLDRGAAVKGRRIDIFMPSCSDARNFGRRRMQVQVLSADD